VTGFLAALSPRLASGRFAREVMTLQVGSLVTMGVQFATSVAIANLLGPNLLGTYVQATAVLNTVNLLANLAVGQALITRLAAAYARRDEDESLGLMAYFLKVSATIGAVEAVVGLLGGSYLGAVIVGDARIGEMAAVLFVNPLLLVFFNMVVMALQSTRQVARLTLLENGAFVLTSLLNVTVVALGWGVTGLLWTVAFTPAITSVAAAILYQSTLPRMPGLPGLGAVVRAAFGVPFRQHFVFSALVSVDKNMFNFMNLLPTLLLSRLASDADVAFFRVGYNLMNFLSVPLAPISRNLYAKLSEILATGDACRLGRSLLRVSLASGGISMLTTLAMLVLSPLILSIYRPEYAAVQPVIYALGLRFALMGFGVGLGPIYQVLDAMKLAIVTKLVPAAIMFFGGWVMVGSYGAVGAALTVVLAYLVGDITNALLVPWMLRRAGSR